MAVERTAPLPVRVVRTGRATCDRCPRAGVTGAASPTRFVAGCGPRRAALVIVGEAPGATEAVTGYPFTGASGRLLWQALVSFGMEAKQVWATNAVVCAPDAAQPLGSDASTAPRARELRACWPRLDDELAALAGRRVVLLLGSKAVETFRLASAGASAAARGAHARKPPGISVLNGRVEWSERWGCWLAYAYHPAAVLRNPLLYPDFMRALRLAVRALNEPLEPPEPDTPLGYIVATDPLECAQTLARIRTGPETRIACDLETTGLDPRRDRILEIGLCWDPDTPYLIPAELLETWPVRERVRQLLEDRNKVWIFHNGKFDIQFLHAAGYAGARVDADTMLLHYALDERGGEEGGFHDLKSLAIRFLGAEPWADEIDAAHMEDVDPDVRHQYHAYDLSYTYQLEARLRDELRAVPAPRRVDWWTPEQTHDWLAIPAANALAEMEERGIRIDTNRLRELQASYERQIAEGRDRCRLLAGSDDPNFNPNSTPQVGGVLYEELGYPRIQRDDDDDDDDENERQRTRRRAPVTVNTTDKASLNRLAQYDVTRGRAPHPFVEAVVEYRSLVHTKGTNLDGVAARLGPLDTLHTQFLQHRTTTGRLSSRNPNLQNIPKHSITREIFVARPGYTLVEADYQRLEVGVLARLSRDAGLLRDYAATDYHWNTAAKVFPDVVERMLRAREDGSLADLERLCDEVSFFSVFARHQSRPSERTEDPDTLFAGMKERLRRQAKFVTFGVMYKEGPESLSNPETGVGCSRAEAQLFIDNWTRAYPRAVAFLNQTVRFARTERWVESATGRRRHFPYPSTLDSHLANEACNMPIQAFASDINLVALVRLNDRLPAVDLGHPLLAVHDSMLSEVRTERLREGVSCIRETMETVIRDPAIRFRVDLATGPNWGALRKWKDD